MYRISRKIEKDDTTHCLIRYYEEFMIDYCEIKKDLKARYLMISELRKRAEEILPSYPAGKLILKHRKNKVNYYLSETEEGNTEKYINRFEEELIRKLAQKAYLESILKTAQDEVKVLKKALDCYPDITVEKVYETLPKERRELVTPVYLPDDEYVRRWQNEPYERKGFSESAAYYLTLKNERVRSKSEQLIADRLNYKGIPYKYECPLKVGDETYHPDFTILRLSDREEIYYEHRGRMDDPKYIEDNMPRYRNYSLNGIVLGEKLFISEETRAFPLDMRAIDDLIERCFR